MHFTLSSRFWLATVLVVGLLLTPHVGGAAPAARDVIPGEYIVVFHDWVANPGDEARVLAAQHGLGLLFVYEHALKGFAATAPSGRLGLLRLDPRVAFISEDRLVWITAQSLPTGVDRIEGDISSKQVGVGLGSVAAAIIDTGIDGTHPDLNVAGGYNCTTRDRKAWRDGHGHGTHVAGTVAAKDNVMGVVGVAPGAPLWAVKVLDNRGSGKMSWVICGIDWVTANVSAKGIKVANMSLGTWGFDDGNCGHSNADALHKAICNSVINVGITYVVAAGNDAINFEGFPPFWPGFVPAAYNEVLTVTAIGDFDGKPGGFGSATCRLEVDDAAASFSNFTLVGSGDEGHTIAAPGVCITSTWKGGGDATVSGTSMASPHVAGTVLLCIQGNNCAGTPGQIIAKIRGDAAVRDVANTYGFADDPNDPLSFINWFYYYGYLAYAGGY